MRMSCQLMLVSALLLFSAIAFAGSDGHGVPDEAGWIQLGGDLQDDEAYVGARVPSQ